MHAHRRREKHRKQRKDSHGGIYVATGREVSLFPIGGKNFPIVSTRGERFHPSRDPLGRQREREHNECRKQLRSELRAS